MPGEGGGTRGAEYAGNGDTGGGAAPRPDAGGRRDAAAGGRRGRKRPASFALDTE